MSWFSKALGVVAPIPTLATSLASGNLFGKKGGYKPTGATLINPFEQEQAKRLYEQTQSGLAQQQAFVNALAGQNALANQANVFRQLQDVVSGTGPNPALAALQQATGQNIAAQNALMAGQRGGSRNVGLLARQAGLQGGALQQQAAGQGATLQAQQQLNALGQLGGLANQQVAQQQAGLGALQQYGLQGQQNILDAIARQNAVAAQQQSSLNQINAQIEADKAKQQAGMFGSVLGALGTIGGLALAPATGGTSLALPAIANAASPSFGSYNFGQYTDVNKFAHGGKVNKYAMGGMAANQPQSYIGQYFQNPNQMLGAINQSDNIKDANLDYSTLNDGGAVNRDGMYAQGGMAPMSLMKQGGKVPGKAVVKGDSYQNDIVDAKLSPGEIVIPRSIVNHPNAPEMAAKFVRDTLAKGNFKNKKGYQQGGGVERNYDEPEAIAYDNPENLEPEIKTLQDPEETKPIESNVPFDVSYNNEKSMQITPEMLKERNVANVTPETPIVQTEEPSLFQKGFNAQRKAYLETGRLAEKQAELEEAEYKKNVLDLEAKQKSYLSELSEVNNEMNNLRSDIMQTKIDPQRFYANMSTGNKIGTAIGLILGGIGAGLTGGENIVLKQLNNYIEQDLYAQKANLGKKESLLSGLMQKYGNVNQAMQMSRIMMTDALSLKMKQIASQYAGKVEAQRLNAEIAKLDQSIAQQVDTFAKARMYASADGVPAEMDPYREQRVLIGNVPYYAGSAQDAQKKMDQINNIDASLATIRQMSDLRNQYGAEFYPGVAKEEMKGLKESLLLQAGPILLGAPITERNRKLVENQIPDPTRFSDVKFANSLREIEGKLIRKKEDIKKSVFKTPMMKR
jgi:hypothetical protein